MVQLATLSISYRSFENQTNFSERVHQSVRFNLNLILTADISTLLNFSKLNQYPKMPNITFRHKHMLASYTLGYLQIAYINFRYLMLPIDTLRYLLIL